MTPWLPLAALGALMVAIQRKTPSRPPQELVELIRSAAVRAGVPLPVALAFARVESNFRADAEGDKDWAARKPANYRALVLDARPNSPWAKDRSLWHSYGLYQLHAAHFALENEDPRALLDVHTNLSRALPYLRKLLDKADGDPFEARYLYVGCGTAGHNCADSVRATIRARLTRALAEFDNQGVA